MRRPTWERRAPGRLIAAVVLAVAAGGATAAVVARADTLAGQYGARRTFPVARVGLAPGHALEEADLAWRELPTALIGGSPPDQVVGRVVVAPILRGEAVVEERLAPTGIAGPMALAPEGTRAVAIPAGAGRPPLAVGDRVDVLTVPLDGTTRARRVATGATVVDVSDEATTVAVEAVEVASTAQAALEQTAVLALVGPREPAG